MGSGPSAAEIWKGYKPASYRRLALAEGDQVLDVGCGAGDDARALAGLVRGVAVVGVDLDPARVADATRLSLGLPRPVEFRVADACRLPFEDGAFDACRADKVFHHLLDPPKALGEMVRVTRPGGRVVVSDVDYDTLVVAAPDVALTGRILRHHADRMESGRAGRWLHAWFRDAGLVDLGADAYTAVLTEHDDEVLHLADKAGRAREAGVVSDGEARAWLDSLGAAERAGRFLCALTVFTVAGRCP
jgi:ubiquinone/menaquinone biosynthesis C-methylase UbiE